MINRQQLNSGAGFTSLATGTGIFAIYFMISSMTLAAPIITREYNLLPSISGFIIQAHLIGAALFLLPAAKMGDFIGHERILCIGGFFFAISSLLCTIFPSELGGFGFIFFRFMQGIGDGMIMASSLVLISRKWSLDKRGEALGMFLFAGYMGYITGLLGGGALIDIFNWKAAFLFTVPITIITGFAGYTLSKSGNRIIDNNARTFDIKGMSIFAPAIIALTIGLTLVPSISSAFLIPGGILLFIFLIIHENKTNNPLFKISLFKENRIFTLTILSDLLYYAAIGAISYLLCIYLEVERGFGSFSAAIVILPISIVQGFISPVSGKLSDKSDPKYISAAGVSIVFIMLIFYSQLDSDTTIITISIIAAIIGGGFALFSAPNKNAIMSSVSSEDHGNASGMANTFEQMGNLASIGIATSIIAGITGATTINQYNQDLLLRSIDLIFLVLAIICLVNVVVILAREKLKNNCRSS